MSAQKFIARAHTRFEFANGAIGWGPGGPFDCLGPYAKVANCPIAGRPDLRLTCYATGYADTFFSIPACTRYRGRYVGGFFTTPTNDDGTTGEGVCFVPKDRHAERILRPVWKLAPLSVLVLGGPSHERYTEAPVTAVNAYPPGQHPPGTPLLSDVTAVELVTPYGRRWRGVQEAQILSSLRMAVRLSRAQSKDETLRGWEDVPEEFRAELPLPLWAAAKG